MRNPKIDCLFHSQDLLKPNRSLERVVALAARTLGTSACIGVPDGDGIVQYTSFAGPGAGLTRTPKVACAFS